MPETHPSTRSTRKDEDRNEDDRQRRDINREGIGEQTDDDQHVGEGVGFAAEPSPLTTGHRTRSDVSGGSGAGQT